jgi:hypothetical protein
MPRNHDGGDVDLRRLGRAVHAMMVAQHQVRTTRAKSAAWSTAMAETRKHEEAVADLLQSIGLSRPPLMPP